MPQRLRSHSARCLFIPSPPLPPPTRSGLIAAVVRATNFKFPTVYEMGCLNARSVNVRSRSASSFGYKTKKNILVPGTSVALVLQVGL